MIKISLRESSSHSSVSKIDFLMIGSIFFLLVICQQIMGDHGKLLAMNSKAILKGDVWRLLSAYFIHANWQHLGINAASLFAAFCLFPEILKRQILLPILLLNALLLSLVMMIILPPQGYYYGFSALLYGLLATSAIYLIKRNPFSYWVLGFLILKLGSEQIFGPLQSSEELVQGNVATWGHLSGATVGTGIGVILFFLQRKKLPPPGPHQ